MSLNLSSFYNIFLLMEQWGWVLFQPWGSHRGERIWVFPENERVRQCHSTHPHFTISTLRFSRKSATMPFNSSLFYKINLEVLKGERGGDENGPGVSVSVSTLNYSSNGNNNSGENGDGMNWNGNGEKPMDNSADENILTRPAFSTPIASFLLSASTIASAFLSTFD